MHFGVHSPVFPTCTCFDNEPEAEIDFHVETQDTECSAWKRLQNLVEVAAADGRSEFAPLQEMDSTDRAQIVTLPSTISKLKRVKHLLLYGSHLVRIPPEIGEMTSLERFTPYTSWRLHWFPYEIARCRNLRDSTVSTRSLYGNYKFAPPFPQLRPETLAGTWHDAFDRLVTKYGKNSLMRPCSVCGQLFQDLRLHRVWISLLVATDVLPLLVNACSEECLQRLPPSAEGYVKGFHRGGVGVQSPWLE
jgi:hypothetical protein